MQEFPSIEIEGRKYPCVIMGEDLFVSFLGKSTRYYSNKTKASSYRKALESAYSLGVRGFTMSPNQTLINILRQFKGEKPDIICISNHHFGYNYYMNKQSLWSKDYLGKIKQLGVNVNYNNLFSKEQINSIMLNEEEYRKQLEVFSFCDFYLVGNLGRNILFNLGRKDIVEREIDIMREKNLIPISICEEPGIYMQECDKMNTSGIWLRANEVEFSDCDNDVSKILKNIKKPVTGYKVLTNLNKFNLEKSINFIKSFSQIKSIVIGVDNYSQAQETFSELHKYWP